MIGKCGGRGGRQIVHLLKLAGVKFSQVTDPAPSWDMAPKLEIRYLKAEIQEVPANLRIA